MSRNQCNIVRDLLPSYIDELCSDDSKAFIEEHLKVCSECKEIYEMMSEGESKPEEITIDQKKIIDNVRSKMQKDIRKRKFAFGIVSIIVILAIVISILPLKNIPLNKVNLEYVTLVTADYINFDEAPVEFGKTNHDDIFLLDDDVDINDASFWMFHYSIERNRMVVNQVVYMEENYIKEHPYITIVDLKSKYPIKDYSYTVNTENGKSILSFDKVKTSFVSSEQIGSYVTKIIVPCQVDDWEIVY